MLFFIAKSKCQRIIVCLLLIYFGYLLFKKYGQNLLVSVAFLAIFFLFAFKNSQINEVSLNEDTVVKVYPDQVKISDDWMSATGRVGKTSILINGKIAAEQKRLLASGKTVQINHLNGEVSQILPATNLGEADYRKYYAEKRITQKIEFKNCQMQPVSFGFKEKLHHLRFNLQQYFSQMPPLLSFFTSELLLAENPSSDRTIMNNYRDLGIIHLLSISGLHVGIYTLVISTILYLLKFTDRQVFFVCVLFLFIGIFLSAGQAGFVRASLTYLLEEIFSLRKWKITGFDLLGLTCLIHLLFLPRLFMSSGAILSYILAFGLQLTQDKQGLMQSFLMNLLLTPFLLFFFFQVNVLTIIFNSLAIPYFNFVVMPASFLNLVIFKLNPSLSLKIELLLKSTEEIIGKISQTKLGLIVFGKINWWECLITVLIAIVLIAYLSKKNAKRKWKLSLAAGLMATYGMGFCLIHFPLEGQVTFIDVGQGDSILITTPFPRKVYLIDTGGKLNFSGKKITPQVNRITLPLLKAQGINQIDGLFVSHQDADHVGDVGPLLEQIKVKKLYMAKGLLNNPSFCKRIAGKTSQTKLVELLAGMQIKEPKINFQVVYPFKPGEGKNEDSLSLTFELAHKRWLFTGDLGQDGEKEIAANYPLKVDYFKLGHHGSKTSSNPDFLKAISPSMVFISAGRNNRFGHPHQETLSTLRSLRIPWASTQDCGMISWYYGFKKPHFERFVMEKME